MSAGKFAKITNFVNCYETEFSLYDCVWANLRLCKSVYKCRLAKILMGENNPVHNSSGTSICKNERHIQSCAKNLMEIGFSNQTERDETNDSNDLNILLTIR